MFAVIKAGGKQYKVTEGDKILVELLSKKIGEEFDFNEIFLVVDQHKAGTVNGEKIQIGRPLVEGAKVHARVLEHGRGDKKIIFKYKSKTRYKKKRSHRQPYTKVEILKILPNGDALGH